MLAAHSRKWQYPEVPITSKQSLQCCIQVMPSLFELVYIVETTPSISLWQSSTWSISPLEKGLDNPQCYFLSTVCNQVVVTNGTVCHVLSMHQGYYYTFSKFIEAVCSEMVNVLPFVSMTIEDKYVAFNVQRERWFFDFDSDNTTIDGFGWTPWFKLSLSTLNMCIIRSLYGSAYDPNSPSLLDGQEWRFVR